GGMGVVYEAEDQRLPRRVALKFLPDELADDADAARRLRREAQTIALLNHPNICTVYDIDEYEGRLFIAMERLGGGTLTVRLARKTLDTGEIVDIASQITAALDAAHSKNVIHRDIKPGNIFIGEQGHVTVLDFGLARRLPEDADGTGGMEGSTIPGRPLGTASYMAPERILQSPLDARSDLFSLGVVIYQMATGRLPFTGASPAETVTNILEHEPTPISTLSPDRPRELSRVVKRLLAKRPEDRYESASALQRDLQGLKGRASSNPLGRLLARLRRP
ncbi:MAG TPA: serine/threonine-protein kinase, partial [Vicinamibacterales bacterium]|nr:serine/threonine-protein kinase [Vicinamibacterales bacterium]